MFFYELKSPILFKVGIFPKESASWLEGVVVPWASRWGNGFIELYLSLKT
jgi:hypothetical protein